MTKLSESTVRNMSTEELLRAVDRSDPEVKELAERLERNSELLHKVANYCDQLLAESDK